MLWTHSQIFVGNCSLDDGIQIKTFLVSMKEKEKKSHYQSFTLVSISVLPAAIIKKALRL